MANWRAPTPHSPMPKAGRTRSIWCGNTRAKRNRHGRTIPHRRHHLRPTRLSACAPPTTSPWPPMATAHTPATTSPKKKQAAAFLPRPVQYFSSVRVGLHSHTAHTAHAAHVATTRHCRHCGPVVGLLGHHRFGGDEETGNGSRIL
jgi:hypothetical protein